MTAAAATQIVDTWPRDALPRGTMLFGYEIVAILGRGGFGITYRAVDRIDQKFAIKECYPRQFAFRQGADVFPADDGDAAMLSECLDRFTKEARALTLFSKSGAAGEGVVKVITFFEANRTAYIVMELIEGESLERLIEANPQGLPQAEVVPMLRHLLGALACVHDNRLLHRDIKPANIFLRRDRRPVLLDFGAARTVQGDKSARFTQVYTEAYAPIEQIAGQQQGPFSDLYALGVTIYHVIAGARFRDAPASTERARAMMSHSPDPLVSAVTLGAGRYDEELLRAIDLLIRVAPEDRPQTVAAFLPLLDRDIDQARSIMPPHTPDDALAPTRIISIPGNTSGVAAGTADDRGGADTVVGYSGGLEPRPMAATMMAHQTAAPALAAAPARGGSGMTAKVVGLLLLAAAAAGGGAYWYFGHRDSAGTAAAPDAGAAPGNPAGSKEFGEANDAYARKDYATAFRLYQTAADAGNFQAQYQLGFMYQMGLGTKADPVMAMSWYKKSADQDFPNAQSQIGYLYQYGLGVGQDYPAAIRWYTLAANKGYVTAQAQLAYMYQHGLGIDKKDYAAALHWNQLAAEQGSPLAQAQLGYLYENGYGVPASPSQALQWYRAAAAQKLPLAEFSVGRFYDEGIGIGRDVPTARYWMTRAAADGSSEAKDWLKSH
jgi:TPR repeat protein/serine/threonine protein kinase